MISKPRLLALFPLVLGMNACMDSTEQASAPAKDPNGETMVERIVEIDGDFSMKLVYPEGKVSAGRVITQFTNKNYRWAPNRVVTVSMFTPAGASVEPIENAPTATPPSILTDGKLIDTTTRAWASLINPDGGNGLAFKILENNDPTANVQIFFTSKASTLGGGTMGRAMPVATWNPDAAGLQLTSGNITIFGGSNLGEMWTNNRVSVYHILLHELGHILNVGHNTDDVFDVMGVPYSLNQQTGAPYFVDADKKVHTTTFQRYFGNNTVETINHLYNGGAANNSPYVPFFTTIVGGLPYTAPILGWANAKLAVEAGKRVILRGIVGRPDNASLPVKIYPVTTTAGKTAYWTNRNISEMNSFLSSNNCPDVASSIGATPAFTALDWEATHPILSTSHFNGLFTTSPNKLLWGQSAPNISCQTGFGFYYDLYPNN